jgi:hypothetical protein
MLWLEKKTLRIPFDIVGHAKRNATFTLNYGVARLVLVAAIKILVLTIRVLLLAARAREGCFGNV